MKYLRQIKKFWKVPDIDLFASLNNAKCEKYISWQRDTNSIAIDAFTVSWKRYFFFAFPPFSVILRVIQKIMIDKAEDILDNNYLEFIGLKFQKSSLQIFFS